MTSTINHRRYKIILVALGWLNFTAVALADELPTVNDLLVDTPFRSNHSKQVLAGEIASTKVVPVSKSELAQGVACLIKGDKLDRLASVQGATWLAPERQIISSARIPNHASVTDFNAIQLQPKYSDEINAYMKAKAGNQLNLSLTEISAFNALQSSEDPQLTLNGVDPLIQKNLLSRYREYREQGLKNLSPYARTRGKEVQPGKQLMISLEESLALKRIYPKIYNALEQYPQASSDVVAVEDYFSYMVDLNDRPAIGLSHRLRIHAEGASFVIERGYYISHTLDTVQIVVALIPVQEGMLLIYTNRTWTEKITGLFSLIKRRIAYNIMIAEMEHVMKNIDLCGAS